MNNKGFTLVEVLATVAILGILIGLTVPASIAIGNRIKTNMYCKKITMLEKSAVLYGQDNYDLVYSKGTTGLTIKVSDLVINGYLKKDNKDLEVGKGAIVNPKTSGSLDNYRIRLKVDNVNTKNRVTATCIESDCTNLCPE
ncbi:MAG: prepilin-type N-terminal cleavage/methylation domain-containing protein [Bacilli bacterium]|nr:prepilin-type N-terminal cleavage/methylation domain-containing protein [Bacilli bacterium]